MANKGVMNSNNSAPH